MQNFMSNGVSAGYSQFQIYVLEVSAKVWDTSYVLNSTQAKIRNCPTQIKFPPKVYFLVTQGWIIELVQLAG